MSPSNPPLLDELNIESKAALMRASPWVVGIISPDLPVEMSKWGKTLGMDAYEHICTGSGTIVECEDRGDGKFCTSILTAASLFIRTDDVQPSDIEVEVYLPDGQLVKGAVDLCDFHYNVALVRIYSDTPLQTALFRKLDDVMFLDPLKNHASFQHRPHSNSAKILPGDLIISPCRWTIGSCHIFLSEGRFSMNYSELDCKELYSYGVNQAEIGGPMINCLGEVIGLMVSQDYFLPSNLILRWLSHCRQFGTFCRPYIGVKFANIHSANWCFLESFLLTFPDISYGVLVTEVGEDSPIDSGGLRREDVIVRCAGQSVRSMLEFAEILWDSFGKSVELTVLRASSGERMSLKISVDDTIPEKFHRWPVIGLWKRKRNFDLELSESESESQSQSESESKPA